MIAFILEDGVTQPEYQTPGAAGLDVTANSILKVFKGDVEVAGEKLEKIQRGFEERGWIKLREHERMLFGTGIQVADMDDNLEIQVRDRSSVALKRGLLVANSPGTVDSDYRGEIGIIIVNSTPFLNKITKGERIAQLVVNQIVKPDINYLTVGVDSVRGDEGFGSTGT